jgi:hypothetical protein
MARTVIPARVLFYCDVCKHECGEDEGQVPRRRMSQLNWSSKVEEYGLDLCDGCAEALDQVIKRVTRSRL